MRKLKLYLDTSVVSHLNQQDAPERMSDTLRLWERIKAGDFDVYLSNVTIGEIIDCPEPKRSLLRKHLSQIKYTLIDFDGDTEINNMAQQIVESGILTRKSYDDCLHIAGAVALVLRFVHFD
jgi:predicted nucleic acid-binding protein